MENKSEHRGIRNKTNPIAFCEAVSTFEARTHLVPPSNTSAL